MLNRLRSNSLQKYDGPPLRKLKSNGSGYCTAVEHVPYDEEVVGSKSPDDGLFSLSLLSV